MRLSPPSELPAAPQTSPPASLGPSSMSLPSDIPGSIGSQGLRSAALAGDPAAAYEIAHRYMDGIGVPVSAVRAAEWFDFAASHGSIPAAYRLGSIYEKGMDGVPRDVARARKLYEQAATAGNVRAMHNLGVLLAAGIDGQPDYREAVVWFNRAAERGVRDSQYNLAVLYARGFGVAVDLSQAWQWFSLAAARGDTEAATKRDEVAARMDARMLAAAQAAIEKWTPQLVDAKANSGSGTQDWNQADNQLPRKTASR
ncbi:MAG TPA: tetratricopeptide repeat protein, partial [Ancylobacter sp.]